MIMITAALSGRLYGQTNQNRGLAAADRKIAREARVEVKFTYSFSPQVERARKPQSQTNTKEE